MGSLQDQLLQSGLVDENELEKARAAKKSRRKPPAGKAGKGGKRKNASSGKSRPAKSGKSKSGDVSLAAAYAKKARAERKHKEETKRARVADQEARRKRNLELDELVKDKALNDDAADVARYFEHIDKVRRVLVTNEQLQAMHDGEIGLVSLRGRYLLLDKTTFEAYREKAPDLVPDLAKPSVSEVEEAGFEVPDDLRW